MTADLVARLGLDDKAFAQGLDNAESKASRAFGRVGQTIDSKTAGLRKFSGALSSTVGIATGLLGAFTAVAAIVGGIVVGISKVVKSQREAAEQAERQRMALEKAAESFEEYQVELGLVNPTRLERTINEIEESYHRQVEALKEQFGEWRRNREFWAQEHKFLRGALEAIEQAKRAERERAAIQEYEAEQAHRRFQLEQQRAELQRQRAAEEEAERTRRVEEDNELFALQFRLEEARAKEQNEVVEALERELELRRRILDVQRREGLSDEERVRLIEQAKRIAEAEAQRRERERQAERDAATATGSPTIDAADPRFRTLGAGTGGGAVLLRQTLGGAAQQLDAERNTILARLLESSKVIERRLQGVGGVFV